MQKSLMPATLSESKGIYWSLPVVDQIRELLGNTPLFPGTWSVFSKSISVSQLVAVPLKSSGSRTSLRSRLPAASN